MSSYKTMKELYENMKPSKGEYENIKAIINDDLSQKDSVKQLEEINHIRYAVMTEIASIDKLLCIVTGIIIPMLALFISLAPTIFSKSPGVIVFTFGFLLVVIFTYVRVVYYYSEKKEKCIKLEFLLSNIYEELNEK